MKSWPADQLEVPERCPASQCVYLHVPFYSSGQCSPDLHTVPYAASLADRFIASVLREMTLADVKTAPRVFYVGGDDPSCLSASQWKAMFTGLQELWGNTPDEWTVETSPERLDTDYAALLAQHGVNRLSLFPSEPAVTLRALGEALRQVANISVTLRLPEQKDDLLEWKDTLVNIAQQGISHLSLTESLEIAEGAEAEEHFIESIQVAEDVMTGLGYDHYEQWSYAKAGFESAYLVHCWRGEDYIGIGPGAASHVAPSRWKNTPVVEEYITAMEGGRVPQRVDAETLDVLEKARELLALGMNLRDGVRLPSVSERLIALYGAQACDALESSNDWKQIEEIFQALEDRGWVTRSGGTVRLTRPGRYFADAVFASIIDLD